MNHIQSSKPYALPLTGPRGFFRALFPISFVARCRALLLAVFFSAFLAIGGAPSNAGPGHDAPPPAAAASTRGDAPGRLPSGEVFLPKPAQRKLNLRTTSVATGEFPRSFELNGRVMSDPNAGGRVQTTQTGRLVPGPNGLPALGQRVVKGAVLGYVEPAIAAVERGNQSAQLADLRAQLDSAQRRHARLSQLDGVVPQKDIDNARIDVDSLKQRAAAVGSALTVRDTLRAPVSGVVSLAGAVAGQVVEARDVLFEIIDPARLMVEALAYEPGTAAGIASAAISVAGASVKLRFIGASAQLREQALPLNFSIDGALPLAVGQPVRVTLQTAAKIKAMALPAAALARNPANETIVWVHTGAEVFAPRTVRTVPLDGARVAVTAGLKDGDRVVVEGVQLVNQVR